MSFLVAIVAFILLLGPLVVVHELGHLLTAKAVGVYAPRFSIGFGKPFYRKRWGETEYCLAPIPIGGYVTLLGQNPYEEIPEELKSRALTQRPLWARYLVIAAGPLANFILPYFIYFIFFATQATTQAAIVGSVVDGYAGDKAGLRAGDQIVAIDGEPVDHWGDLVAVVSNSPGESLALEVLRKGERLELTAVPDIYVEPDEDAFSKGLLNVTHDFHEATVYVRPHSLAATAGLQTGDVIRSVAGEQVLRIEQLDQLLMEAARKANHPTIPITVERTTSATAPLAELLTFSTLEIGLHMPNRGPESMADFGLESGETVLRRIDANSPASRAGLQPGDRILSIDGKPTRQWAAVQRAFEANYDAQAQSCAPLTLEIESPTGERRTLKLAEELLTVMSSGQSYKVRILGVRPWLRTQAPPAVEVRNRLRYAHRASVQALANTIERLLDMLRRMLTREKDLSGLASFLGIGIVAGNALETGPTAFMRLMVAISINLGIVNLLPIPVLDGGHLLFFTIEAITRRPLGHRVREIASGIGLLLIAILMIIALRNDIGRLISAF